MVEKKQIGKLKVRCYLMSGAAPLYIVIFYFVIQWGILLASVPVTHFFPDANCYVFLLLMPLLVVFAYLVFCFLECFCYAYLDENQITVRCLGITIRTISVSKLRVFCAIGNEGEDMLCLSCRTVDEMAQQQEKRLLKSFLNKHNVPFRKRKTDWKDSFAQEYLNTLIKNPLGILKAKDIVILKMNPALQYVIQHKYPLLSYKNLTCVRSCYPSRYKIEKEDQVVGSLMHLCNDRRVELRTDGVHILVKREEVTFIPAQKIKTVLRVDVFKRYEKYYPHHMPIMVISCLTEDVLATQAPRWLRDVIGESLPNRQALLAMAAMTDKALSWTIKSKDYCAMHYTEKNAQTIRELYPNACFNDISASWIFDAALPGDSSS